jgi:xanthosine utilization system XapX-like protein
MQTYLVEVPDTVLVGTLESLVDYLTDHPDTNALIWVLQALILEECSELTTALVGHKATRES